MSLKIVGTGKGIPARSVTNQELSDFLDTSDEWIVSRTGIKSRNICSHETLSDLSAAAARQALEKSHLLANEIDLIICSTIEGDFRTPSLACCLSHDLGTMCPAFDVNAGCTGFIYALEVASSFLAAKKANNILIVCAEMMSTHMDWTDRNTCVLFGDGAAACVVTNGNALKYLDLSVTANPAVLNIPSGTGNNPFVSKPRENGFVNMRGQDVFKFAVGAVETGLKQALHALNVSTEQIDLFLLHQANKRIVDSIRTKLQQPEEKFPINIERYGNLSSASIPLLLFELLEENKIKSGDTLFMSAFGAGLTTGNCVMVWE
ncbi:MAG: ketoacyl-ACP synthase III [Peptococcaceae bacterium]|nr:ketoacyl-ACP synthase III [Peptococcaceae bacterium]